MRWTVHLQGGPTRVNHAAVKIGNIIYCFGGYCSTEEFKDWDPMPVHMLNTDTLRWSQVFYESSNYYPFKRYGHTTVAYKSKVYMWGGRNNSVACETLSVFNTKTITWSKPFVKGCVPFAKDGHSACLVENFMYIFGGFEYVADSLTNEIHCLNLDTLNWHLVNSTGTAPSPRDFHTAITVGPKMYVYGGRSDLSGIHTNKEELYCTELYCFDTEKNKWITPNPEGSIPIGRRSHSSWYYNGAMYVFGGFNSITRQHYNSVHKYSIADNCWYRLRIPGKCPCIRRRQCCIINKDKLYLFGGTGPVNPNADFDFNDDHLRDKGDLHVLDFRPTLRTLALETVIAHKLNYKLLPLELRLDVLIMSVPNMISKPQVEEL